MKRALKRRTDYSDEGTVHPSQYPEKPKLYFYDGSAMYYGKNRLMSRGCDDLYGDCTNLLGDCDCLEGDCSLLRGNASRIYGKIGIRGDVTNLQGCITGLRGDCSHLWGNCSGLTGCCNGIRGDCTGIEGNLDDCDIGIWDMTRGIRIEDLVEMKSRRLESEASEDKDQEGFLKECEFRELTKGCFYQDELRKHDYIMRKKLGWRLL